MFGILKWLRSLFTLRKEEDTDSYTLKLVSRTIHGSAFKRSGFQCENLDTHQSSIEKDALDLTLRRASCMAWSELEDWRVADMDLAAELSYDKDASYSATGLIFRKNEDDNYYLLLVSNKGWWRLDVVFNGKPRTLIAWTEVPATEEEEDECAAPEGREDLHLRIIALDSRIAIVINNNWAGEIQDDTLFSGTIALALASYEEGPRPSVRLEKISIEGQPRRVEESWIRWTAYVRPRRTARLALAKTFHAMGQPSAALIQVQRIWKRNEDRRYEELILAADCAIRLSLYEEADKLIQELLSSTEGSESEQEARALLSTLLYLKGSYEELAANTQKLLEINPDNRVQRTLLAHAHANLGKHLEAAKEYDTAAGASPDTQESREEGIDQGILLKNAAQEYENAGETALALERWLAAGRVFLNADRHDELSNILPSLLNSGANDARVHALCAKHHFAREDYTRAKLELQSARNLAVTALADKGEKENSLDPAVPYLEALLLIREGKRDKAIPLLEEARAMDKDFFPFLFRLVECRWIKAAKSERKILDAELSEALAHPGADGWLFNLAAQIYLERNKLSKAEEYLNRAQEALGPLKEVLVNQAELASLRGEHEKALEILDGSNDEDQIIDTARGNILYRLDRLDEAEEAFRAALKKTGDQAEGLRNLAGCLIEQGRYGEADELLARACEIDPGRKSLELIAYVASKKGEYPRAEAALRMALDIDEDNIDLLFSLAWNYLQMSRPQRALETLERIASLAGEAPETLQRISELREAVRTTTHRTISCSSCERSWSVPRDIPPQGILRLVAEPPDEMPAGICPRCEKVYCIGCAKESLSEGRFHCPHCREALKLSDEGLKKVLIDWLATVHAPA